MLESLKGWRTIIFGAIIAALGSVDATGLATVIPQQYVGLVITGIGLVTVWLRSQTTTAVGQK